MTDELDRKGRVFTQEEVNTVLSRAVERQNPSAGGLTYAELIDTARQAGIDPEAIDEAVSDLQSGRETADEDGRVKGEIARRKWRSLRAFSIHFTVFAMFSLLIMAIGWKNGDIFPGIVSTLAWGIGIAAHFTAMLFSTVLPSPDRAEAVRRELRKRDEKDERRGKKERKQKERRPSQHDELQKSAKELGVAVQRGMAVVLSDVAKAIHEEVDASRAANKVPGVRVGTKARVGSAAEVEGREIEDDGSDREDAKREERGARSPGRR